MSHVPHHDSPHDRPFASAPAPAPVQLPVREPRNGLGLTALILGLLGALSGLVPILFWASGTLGVIGLVLGLAGRSRAKKGLATNGRTALTGLLLSLLSFALGVWGLITVVTALDDAANEIDKELNSGAPPAAVLPLTAATR
ncbi:hypothetical protein DTL70_26705 [Streptomyces diacarni]|uniref:DUF4190 domain-containing protein n=1 Tax=Streptomyces diacarni TaxID=2800381 RepID=A0A367EJI1_9ACTN|nr:hypothetical protein [Streptomyces diacarni]RCG17852.1 hypothetical protein DTL70_26705 [Streptomyces diacarni]